MRIFTRDQIRKINKTALAEKHGCSAEYVGQVLRGVKSPSSEKARSIIDDVKELLEILEPQNSETNV